MKKIRCSFVTDHDFTLGARILVSVAIAKSEWDLDIASGTARYVFQPGEQAMIGSKEQFLQTELGKRLLAEAEALLVKDIEAKANILVEIQEIQKAIKVEVEA